MKQLIKIFAISSLIASSAFAMDTNIGSLDLGTSIDVSVEVKEAQKAVEAYNKKRTEFATGSVLDIFSGKISNNAQTRGEFKQSKRAQLFAQIYGEEENALDREPEEAQVLENDNGSLEIFRDDSGKVQIRGNYKGASFDSTGDRSEHKFTGRFDGSQDGVQYVQFFTPSATVILAINYPISKLSQENQDSVSSWAPETSKTGFVGTIVLIIRDSGLEVVGASDASIAIR